MSQRPRLDGTMTEALVPICARIPRDLHIELKVLALDPHTGRIPYGGWSHLIEDALRLWVESKKVRAA